MSDVAIRAKGLGKKYRIGRRERYRTLRDTLANAAAAPVRWVRSLATPGPRVGDHGETDMIWALEDASFEVAHGAVLGIIGRNGAGKSTLLKILSRITEPTTGRAEIRGRVGSLLEVGTGFHPELTGRENMFLNGAILGMKKAEVAAKFDEIVAFAEIEKFLDTPVKHYSTGMYMRLAFAVAAHLEPEILVVDEVLAVGDARFQRKCLGKMSEVSGAGRTILFVSHNMTAIQALSQHVLWLADGRVRGLGEAHAVVVDYLREGSEMVNERAWDSPETAPGNDQIRLHSVRIVSPDRLPPDQMDIHTPFAIEFAYWNLDPGLKLNLSVMVHTQEGVCAFVTASTVEPSWHGKPFPTGLFRSTCHVPRDLLNDNVYRVTLLFVKDSTTVLHVEEGLLSFEIHDSLHGRDEWYGKWQGVVRPALGWTTERIEELAPVLETA